MGDRMGNVEGDHLLWCWSWRYDAKSVLSVTRMIHSWLKETGGADTAHTGIVYFEHNVCSDLYASWSLHILKCIPRDTEPSLAIVVKFLSRDSRKILRLEVRGKDPPYKNFLDSCPVCRRTSRCDDQVYTIFPVNNISTLKKMWV